MMDDLDSSEAREHSGWPADINDWEDWPESVDLNYLCSRIDHLTLRTFKNVLLEEILDGDEAFIVATTAAERQINSIARLKWLQEPLYNPNVWPEWNGDGFWVEYLTLMWSVTEEASRLRHPEQAASTLMALMEDPDVWQFPLGPAAIVAQCPIPAVNVNSILQTFVSGWRSEPSGGYEFRGHPLIEADASSIRLCAPLLAICCLHPEADPMLVKRVAATCSEASGESAAICDHFWQYVACCMLRRQEGRGDWCPYVTWRDGFFGNGLPDGLPQVGANQLAVLAGLFLNGYRKWDFEADRGFSETREGVATAMASRPELADELLQGLAASSVPRVAQAVLANPAASDHTRALAALHT